MPDTSVANRLAGVRLRVDQVFQMLVQPSPEKLQQCEVLLEAALEEFESSRPLWARARGDRQALIEACQVRRAVGQAGRLLGTASAFYARWRQWLATQSGGYTAGGEPAQLRGQSRISLQG